MVLELLKNSFCCVKVKDINEKLLKNDFVFLSKTNEEISMICPNNIDISNEYAREDNYRGFRIKGELDFSLIGILAKISTILAENEISILAVSTYNTDYVFVKEENFKKAINALKSNDYEIKMIDN